MFKDMRAAQLRDFVEVLLPGADVTVGATVVRLEHEQVFRPLRWLVCWSDAFGGIDVILFTASARYRVVDRPRTREEAIQRVMDAQAHHKLIDDPESAV